MKIIGYSLSQFVGKTDNITHTNLTVQFAYEKNDETHVGFYYVKSYNFIDKKKDFYNKIADWYNKGTELKLLFNQYGKVEEIQVQS